MRHQGTAHSHPSPCYCDNAEDHEDDSVMNGDDELINAVHVHEDDEKDDAFRMVIDQGGLVFPSSEQLT